MLHKKTIDTEVAQLNQENILYKKRIISILYIFVDCLEMQMLECDFNFN